MDDPAVVAAIAVGAGVIIGLLFLSLRLSRIKAKERRRVISRYVAKRQRRAQSPEAVADEDRRCGNCSRPIGKMENAYTFKGHIVCGECDRRLHSSSK